MLWELSHHGGLHCTSQAWELGGNYINQKAKNNCCFGAQAQQIDLQETSVVIFSYKTSQRGRGSGRLIWTRGAESMF